MAGNSKRAARPVYVIGAGFSAGLGFPLVHDLLVRLWPRLPEDLKPDLAKVVQFHNPGFDPNRATSFPTIEHLLSEMMVNEQLFHASRASEGAFKLEDLIRIRRDLLLCVARDFDDIHKKIMESTPTWLNKICHAIREEEAIVVSFNWDLVLDEILFGDKISPQSYGLNRPSKSSTILLKPHGSLNWYEGPTAKFLKRDKRFTLYAEEGEKEVFAFKGYRQPVSRRGRVYMPLIIPPVYGKTFEAALFKEIWRATVSALSKASKIVFLGYSMPDADLHAKFILRCGFHNQKEGEITKWSGRTRAPGTAPITVVNPDAGSARRIEAAIGEASEWKPMTVAKWVEDQS